MSSLGKSFELCPRCGHEPEGRLHGHWCDYGIEQLYAQVRCPHCGLESDYILISPTEMTAFEKELCVDAWDEAVNSYLNYGDRPKTIDELSESEIEEFFKNIPNFKDDDIMTIQRQ